MFPLAGRLGLTVSVNDESFIRHNALLSVDVETDEKDNLVGLAIAHNDKHASYFTCLTDKVKDVLQTGKLIGHSVAGDIDWLNKWGCSLTQEHIYADTLIMSYCFNTAKESHSLKVLARELFGWEWPTYREMVGKGRTKLTLDKQPVERVADYCSVDAIASFKVYGHWLYTMPASVEYFYTHIEMPLYRLLWLMKKKGVRVDTEATKVLDDKFRAQIEAIKAELQAYVGPIKVVRGKKRPTEHIYQFNPNSTKQIHELLYKTLGISEKSTDGPTLKKYKAIPQIEKLMSYRKLTKLQGTYTGALLALPTMPYIHTTFSQLSAGDDKAPEDVEGIVTGRLSSRDPNLQNIPRRGEYGAAIRGLFVADPGCSLLCADWSQIEYRILAHVSQEPILLEAFRAGKDVHEETGRLFGVDREIGKTLNFMAIYGGQAAKAAALTGLPETECKKLLDSYWDRLPNVTRWKYRVQTQAHKLKGTRTLFGRWIPLSAIDSPNKFERWHWERAAVNYAIQGGASEIIKLAMLRLWKMQYVPLLTVHDELLFSVPEHEDAITNAIMDIQDVMENVVQLSVPLTVNIGVGKTWQEAK